MVNQVWKILLIYVALLEIQNTMWSLQAWVS